MLVPSDREVLVKAGEKKPLERHIFARLAWGQQYRQLVLCSPLPRWEPVAVPTQSVG